MICLKNANGFTIIENLVALALLGIIFFSMTLAFTNIFNIEARTTNVVNEQQMVAMIIETVKAEPSVFQKNFSSTSTKNALDILTVDSLPLGFERDYFGPRAGCPSKCEGYVGFTIQPFEGFQSLFEGTILVHYLSKDPRFPENVTNNVYRFLVNSN